MVVAPCCGNDDGTLVNALLHHCGDSLSRINGITRLVLYTALTRYSGLLIVAKTILHTKVGATNKRAQFTQNI